LIEYDRRTGGSHRRQTWEAGGRDPQILGSGWWFRVVTMK